MNHLANARKKVSNISNADLTIYDVIEVGNIDFWLTSEELEAILNYRLKGLNLNGLALRTRSKRVKIEICTALGYPIPKSFKKTQPRFLGQQFDTYTQKSNNLQIWNEDLDLVRRYVLIRISKSDTVLTVKVVSGSNLAPLDTTGTLTQKYQAKLNDIEETFELVSEKDTDYIIKLCSQENNTNLNDLTPIDNPSEGEILPIKVLFDKLGQIIGHSFINPGSDQERNRGAVLHKLACEVLGYNNYMDNGQFPDIKNQLLEIKLQTSSTIDLGLISPNSEVPLDMEQINGIAIRHCDVRYAIFYGHIQENLVIITNLIVTNGRDFFERFPKFKGKGLNKKIQIPLPRNFFDKSK